MKNKISQYNLKRGKEKKNYEKLYLYRTKIKENVECKDIFDRLPLLSKSNSKICLSKLGSKLFYGPPHPSRAWNYFESVNTDCDSFEIRCVIECQCQCQLGGRGGRGWEEGEEGEEREMITVGTNSLK